jgi:hypothetical protein
MVSSSPNNKLHLLKKCISIVLPSSMIALTFFVKPSISQKMKMRELGKSKIFLIERLSSDNKLTLKVYKADSNPIEIIDLSGLDITEEGKSFLNGSYFSDIIPDFKLNLLKAGHASIKLGSNALEAEENAQEQAKISKIGMWVEPPPKKDVDWLNVIKLIGGAVVGLGTLYGFKHIIDLLLKFLKCRPVDLIMLGLGSAGKSWIIARLMNPDISEAELIAINITNVATKITGATMPVGKYEVIPTYVDTAGGQPGSQIKVMSSKKNKSIWVIVLSTTDKNKVDYSSKDDDKINHSHLEQQLGYLRFPLEMLESSFCKKPEMVIVCIGKFDIFSEDPPATKNAKSAEEKLEKLFEKHISQVKGICRKKDVKFVLILCSALKKKWNTEQLESCVKTALYPKMK